MKRMKKSILLPAALALCLVFGAACGKTPAESADSFSSEESGSGSYSYSYVAPVEVSFYQKEIMIETNRTLALQYKVEGSTETPVFTSSAENIVRISADGTIETLAEGTAVITATLEGAEATCTIIVTETTDYPRLILSRDAAELLVGRSVRVVAEVYFRREQVEAGVRYRSSDPSVATVGEDGTITGAGAGTATIYVTAEWQGIVLTETVAVTVKAA